MSRNIDDIEKTVSRFNDGLIDDIVGDNTLTFTAEDSEAAKRAREERRRDAEIASMKAEKDASDLVDSAKSLYSKSSSNIEYVQFKGKADANSLGKILYQVEVTEDAIRTVVDAIQDGDTNTNLFKCLTDLQKTMLELLKAKNAYLTSIEDSFKQLTNDVEMSSAIEIEGEDEPNVLTAKAKNGRELMQLISEATDKIEEEKKQKMLNDERTDKTEDQDA